MRRKGALVVLLKVVTGTGSVSTPACPAGYVMTGGGGGGHSFNTYIAYSGPLGSTTAATSWIVSGKTGVSSDNFDAFAYCVRTPGQVRS